MLAQADFVALCLPLTRESRHLIDEKALRAIKPTAYLINVARGEIVDEAALLRALREGWMAGAGLDVVQQEPLDYSNPLVELPNVIVTPHVAGLSDRYAERVTVLFCDNLRRHLAGEPLRNLVDRERGY